MVTVGIIANPASGKDIRRIVAQGWVVSNQEKIAIVRRLLRGLEAGGVDRALFMPESLGIGYAAVEALGSTKIQVDILPMDVQANQEDSTRAAERMATASRRVHVYGGRVVAGPAVEGDGKSEIESCTGWYG